MPQYVVLYCYKVNAKGRMRADGIARCNEACRTAAWLGNDASIVFSVDIGRMPKMLAAMVRQFGNLGWPLERIIALDTSISDTLAETQCAQKFLRQHGAGGEPVHVVTSRYHMKRVIATWRHENFRDAVIPHPSLFSETPFISWLHEQGAFLKFFIRKIRLPIARF